MLDSPRYGGFVAIAREKQVEMRSSLTGWFGLTRRGFVILGTFWFRLGVRQSKILAERRDFV